MGDNPRFAISRLVHFGQIAFARASDFLDHSAGIFIIHIDRYFFDWLKALAVFAFAHQNLWARD